MVVRVSTTRRCQVVPEAGRESLSWPKARLDLMLRCTIDGWMGVNLRNLEQIQEQDGRRAGFPLGTLFLSALAGGALMVTAMLLLQREEPAVDERDPLTELIDEQQRKPQPAVVEEEHVTFPGLLSDHNRPTTALAAVKDERGRLIEAEPDLPASATAASALPAPLPLPKVLRPAGDLLSSSSVTQQPKDDLTQLAKERASDTGELAPPGMQGGYEIQVASFKNPDDADAFAEELRKRGHRAYRQAAYVPEKGLWHRVRVGPFKAKYQAEKYQRELEAAERISTFLIDPDKVRRQQAIRDAKAKARERREQRRQRQAANR